MNFPSFPPLFFPGSASHLTLQPPSSEWHRGMGTEIAVSLLHFISPAASSSCSSRTLPQNCLWWTTPPSVCITGCSPSGTDWSSMSLPWDLSFCWESAPLWALDRLQLPSGHIHLLWHGVLYGLWSTYQLCCCIPWASGWQPTPPWSSSWATGELLLQCQYLHPLPVCRVHSHIVLTPLPHSCCTAFFILTILSQKCHQQYWWVELIFSQKSSLHPSGHLPKPGHINPIPFHTA